MHVHSIPRLAMLAAAALLASACGGSTTPPSPPALEVACSGATCGAASPSLYSGSGTGIWRYRNGTGAPVTLDVSIGGVRQYQSPVLIFSNGGATNRSLPGVGTLPAAPAGLMADPLLATAFPSDADVERDARHRAEWEMTERNRELALSIAGRTPVAPSGDEGYRDAAVVPRQAPTVGTRRIWNDTTAETLASYSTVAQETCLLPEGRTAVFWVDEKAWTDMVSAALLTYFKDTFCGATGGYARVTGMRGQPWGIISPPDPELIAPDAPGALQDLNVVFLAVPDSVKWGGIFHGTNAFKKGAYSWTANSNQALAFFVNARLIGGSINPKSFASTLLHELTHLVNFYQRSLVQSSGFDTWLEEMSAMMTEDIVTKAVTSDSQFVTDWSFVQPCVKNGGGTSLINWGYLGSSFYDVGGSLGAFLNRKYGTAIYTGMLRCARASAATGHACVDSLILQNGGAGLEDEFARLGATLYGLLPVTGTPAGYGFPQKVTTELASPFTLDPIDVSAYAANRPATATTLENGFQATSYTYKADAIPAGRTTYSRSGVVIPPETTLFVVIQAPVTFTLSAAPNPVEVARGGSVETTVTVTRAEGTGTVALAATVAPPAPPSPLTTPVTAELTPSAVQSGATATLKVTAAALAPTGIYTVTVTGTSISGTATVPVTVTVIVPPT